MTDYVATSSLGLRLHYLRLAIASSATLQSLAGVSTVADALPYVTYEDPFEFREDNFFTLPTAHILRGNLNKTLISGGQQPHLFPDDSEVDIYIKFAPDAAYHDAQDGQNEWHKAQDTAGKIYDEITGSDINGADISYGGATIPLPSITGSMMECRDSRSEYNIQDIQTANRGYRYFYFALMRLEVKP